MSLIARVKDTSKNAPPGYAAYKTAGIPHEFYPFAGGIDAVNRFAARYRFAKEFQAASFETYSPSTAAGYSALCKFLFTYAAFEALRRAIGWSDDLAKLDAALERYPRAEWDANIRAAPTHQRLFVFMSRHLKKGLKAQCERFLAREPYNVLLLSQALRNSFSHAHLTPNANRTEPEDMRTICAALGDALFMFMDVEFGERVRNTIEDIYTIPVEARGWPAPGEEF